MKMKHIFWLVILLSGMAFAQGVRYDSVALNPRGAPIPNATITLCTGTATGTPCSPAALGYTDITTGTSCASGFPVVQQIGGGCTSTTDGNGNFGFWLIPGTYKYSISGPSVATPQTYTITVPLGATSGGVATPCNVNGALYVGSSCYPATAAGINAAIQALPASGTGGMIWLPGGLIPISSTIVIDRPVHLRGLNGNYNDRGTTLQWTGGASVAIAISSASGASTGTSLDDIALDNTGTGTVGIDIDNNAVFVSLNRVYSVPTVGWSTAGLRIGNTTSGSAVFDVYLNETDFENSTINLLLLRCFNFVSVRGRYVNGSTNEIQIGDSTHTVRAAHFYGYDIEPSSTTNVTEISVLNASNVTFTDGFGEQTGPSSLWLDCPSTATACDNIAIRGGWHQSNGTGPQSIVHSNLSTATISIESGTSNNFPASSVWIKNDNSRRIWLSNLVGDGNTSLVGGSLSNANVTFLASNAAGTPTQSWFNDPVTFRGDVLFSTNLSTASRLLFSEGTAPSASGESCYADSTAHALKCSYNAGSYLLMPQTLNTTSGTTQSKRGVSGCTTGSSAGNSCGTDITVTWGTAFPDANYSVTCTGNAPTNVPSAPFVTSGTKLAATVHINYFAITAAAASYATIDCTAVHD